MIDLSPELRRALQRRAHVHTDRCYGTYEPCGEHHAHDDQCGSRPLRCGLREDPDLVALLHYVIDLERRLAARDAEWQQAWRDEATVGGPQTPDELRIFMQEAREVLAEMKEDTRE
jgi:hypothetical protein